MLSIFNKLQFSIDEIPLFREATKPLWLNLSLTRVEDLKPTFRVDQG